jgi:mevalonate kinase
MELVQLRQSLIDGFTSDRGRIIVFTNIKRLSSESEYFYGENIGKLLAAWHHVVGLSLSVEPIDQYPSCFGGFIHLLESTSIIANSGGDRGVEEYSRIILMDGGRKTRNFLCTLSGGGFAGLIPTIDGTVWEWVFLSCLWIKCTLNVPNDWILLVASDYVVLPGNKGPEPEEEQPLQELGGMIPLDDDLEYVFAEMDAILFVRPIHIATLPAEVDLCSKGIVVSRDGRFIRFVEKPDGEELEELLHLVASSPSYALWENVMLSALHQRLLLRAHQMVDMQLLQQLPVSFYAALFEAATTEGGARSFADRWSQRKQLRPAHLTREECENQWRQFAESSTNIVDPTKVAIITLPPAQLQLLDLGTPLGFTDAMVKLSQATKGLSPPLQHSVCWDSDSYHVPATQKTLRSTVPAISIRGPLHRLHLSRVFMQGAGRVVLDTTAAHVILSDCCLQATHTNDVITIGGAYDCCLIQCRLVGSFALGAESCGLCLGLDTTATPVISLNATTAESQVEDDDHITSDVHVPARIVQTTVPLRSLSQGSAIAAQTFSHPMLLAPSRETLERNHFAGASFLNIAQVLSLHSLLCAETHLPYAKQGFLSLDGFIERECQGTGICRKSLQLNAPLSHRFVADYFQWAFPNEMPQVIASAPGRINLCGAHTDWSLHTVLGTAVKLLPIHEARLSPSSSSSFSSSTGECGRTYVAAAAIPSRDSRSRPAASVTHLRLISLSQPPGAQRRELIIDIDGGGRKDGGGWKDALAAARLPPSDSLSWSNYVLGILHADVEGIAAWLATGEIERLDLMLCSDLPQGVGLSSSASLEVAVAGALTALRRQEDPSRQPQEVWRLAKLGNVGENSFVGVDSGMLDQGMCAFGRSGHLLSLQCGGEDSFPSAVPLPLASRCTLAIINTGTSRSLAAFGMKGGVDPIVSRYWWETSEVNAVNLRVRRYWFGVSFLLQCATGQYEGMARLQKGTLHSSSAFVRAMMSVYGEETLLVVGKEDYLRLQTIAAQETVPGTSVDVNVDVDDNDNTSPSTSMPFKMNIPVLMEKRIEANANAEQLTVPRSSWESLVAQSQFPRHLEVRIADLLDLVMYIISENERIQILSGILRGSLHQWLSEDNVAMRQEVFLSLIEEMGMLAASLYPSYLYPQLILSELLERLSPALSGTSSVEPMEFSLDEMHVMFAMISELSWVYKRDFFKGDSKYGTLERAFSLARSMNDMVAEHSPNERILPPCFGIASLGAGWAGTLVVFIARSDDENTEDCFWLPLLEYLFTGNLPQDCPAAMLKLTSQLDVVPYCQNRKLRKHCDLDPNKVAIWRAETSNGLQCEILP